jgi:hypothetical protein
MLRRARPPTGRSIQNAPDFPTLLPAIEHQLQFAFRRVPQAFREDVIQEAIARALVAHRRLVERGCGGRIFASPLARFAVLRVRDGRRVGSPTNRQDVSCPFVARRHHFYVRPIDRFHRDSGCWAQITLPSGETPVPDQVAFRLDFRQWLLAQSRRNRRIIEALASGATTSEAARQFQISAARVSQLRLQFYKSWHALQAEVPGSVARAAA